MAQKGDVGFRGCGVLAAFILADVLLLGALVVDLARGPR